MRVRPLLIIIALMVVSFALGKCFENYRLMHHKETFNKIVEVGKLFCNNVHSPEACESAQRAIGQYVLDDVEIQEPMLNVKF